MEPEIIGSIIGAVGSIGASIIQVVFKRKSRSGNDNLIETTQRKKPVLLIVTITISIVFIAIFLFLVLNKRGSPGTNTLL